jgi:hypothetical protein
MNNYIEKITAAIDPLRAEIINHKVYSVINDLADLQIFMQYHVFAVWDFMSILKALQQNLTCTTVPWFPKGSAETRHLINEIVLGEESDVDAMGNRKSHFELYLEAMAQSGANTASINEFITSLQAGSDFQQAYEAAKTPEAARAFVDFTFEVINSGKSHLQAAIFTFGREDLIPGMFHSIINDMHKDLPERVDIFKYYLDRHIEVDGDHHSHLALQMIANLCGDSEQMWAQAEQVTIDCLKMRIALWDGVYTEIIARSQQDPEKTASDKRIRPALLV